MRMVVDTNYLTSPKLRDYLSEPSNFAVLTDYAFIEAQQGDSPASIRFFKSAMRSVVHVLCASVIVLASTRLSLQLRSIRARVEVAGGGQGAPTPDHRLPRRRAGSRRPLTSSLAPVGRDRFFSVSE